MEPLDAVPEEDCIHCVIPFRCAVSNNAVRLGATRSAAIGEKVYGFRSGSILTSEDEADPASRHEWVCVLTSVEQMESSPEAKRVGLTNRHWSLTHKLGDQTAQKDKPLHLVNYREIVACRPPENKPEEALCSYALGRLFVSLILPAYECNMASATVHYSLDEWQSVKTEQVS